MSLLTITPILAAASGSLVLWAVVWLAVLCIIWLAADYFGVPDPFKRLIQAVLVIGGIVILIRFLLNITGVSWP